MTCFPLGEVPPQAGIGVHFHRPKGGLFVFPSPARAVVKVLYKLAPLYFQRAPTEAFPPERSDATLLYNPWHRGPSGPMDAICPSAAQRQAPSGIQESTAPPTGIYWHSSHLLFLPRSFVSVRMTSGRQGSPATSNPHARQGVSIRASIYAPKAFPVALSLLALISAK